MLLAFPFLAVFERVRTPRIDLFPTDCCRACHYDLHGLGGCGNCPECGCAYAEFYSVVSKRLIGLRVSPGRLAFVGACVGTWIMFVLVVQPWFAQQIGAMTYLADGYSWTVSTKAATVRGDAQYAGVWIAVYLWLSPAWAIAGGRVRWIAWSLGAGLVTLITTAGWALAYVV